MEGITLIQRDGYKMNEIPYEGEVVNAIKRKSADALPDSPAACGMKASAVKPKFWHPLVQGEVSLLGIINVLIIHLNEIFENVDNRLKYTQIRINDSTNMWEISTDGGKEWQSTGVKATPTRGQDYWTDKDIAAIKGYVAEAILNGEW
jgi:hypothetical protein